MRKSEENRIYAQYLPLIFADYFKIKIKKNQAFYRLYNKKFRSDYKKRVATNRFLWPDNRMLQASIWVIDFLRVFWYNTNGNKDFFILTKEEKAQFAIRRALRKKAILCLNEKN